MTETVMVPDTGLLEEFRESQKPKLWIVTHPDGRVEETMAITGYDAKSEVIGKHPEYSEYTLASLLPHFQARRPGTTAGRVPNDQKE